MVSYKTIDGDPVMVFNGPPSGDLVESWIFASSGRDFSIYAERLLLRMVQVAQQQLLGVNFKDGTGIGQVKIGPLGEAKLEIPLRSIMGEGTAKTNYTSVKLAVMELMKAPYFVERPKLRKGEPVLDADGNPEYEFRGRQILNSVDVNTEPGAAVIEVNKDTWAAILDFSKGFRKFDLETALKLKLPCSLRLFKLLSNQSSPVTFTIEQLRHFWKMDQPDSETGRIPYEKTYDFIRGNIIPAKKELDAKSPWSFEWTGNKSLANQVANDPHRKGSKAITSITFFPKYRATMEPVPKVLRIYGSALNELGRECYDLLVHKFEFTQKGLQNNIELFYLVKKSGMDLRSFLDVIAPNALRVGNTQGYVINAIRAFLTEQYGIEFDEHGKAVSVQEDV